MCLFVWYYYLVSLYSSIAIPSNFGCSIKYLVLISIHYTECVTISNCDTLFKFQILEQNNFLISYWHNNYVEQIECVIEFWMKYNIFFCHFTIIYQLLCSLWCLGRAAVASKKYVTYTHLFKLFIQNLFRFNFQVVVWKKK